DPDNPDNAWVVIDGALYASTNAMDVGANVTWTLIDLVPNAADEADHIAASPSNPQIFHVTTGDDVYRTEDGGQMFFSTNDQFTSDISGPRGRTEIFVDPSDADVLWAASDAYPGSGLYRYTKTSGWERFELPDNADRWARHVAVDPTNSDRIAVVTGQDPYVDVNGGTGVWLSRDGGQTWEQENDNLPVTRFKSVVFSPDGNELIIGSGGRGFFRAELDGDGAAEAENLTLGAGPDGAFTQGWDGKAGGGQYLALTGPDASANGPSGDAAVAAYTFTLDSAMQDPTVLLRIAGEGSVFLRVDQGQWQQQTVLNTPDWAWADATISGTTLDQGRHTLEIARGSGDIRLDAVRVGATLQDPIDPPKPTGAQ
ncbi:MAG: hypothetical protein AAGL98_14325, partial [Planctomycetota bacterium]